MQNKFSQKNLLKDFPEQCRIFKVHVYKSKDLLLTFIFSRLYQSFIIIVIHGTEMEIHTGTILRPTYVWLCTTPTLHYDAWILKYLFDQFKNVFFWTWKYQSGISWEHRNIKMEYHSTKWNIKMENGNINCVNIAYENLNFYRKKWFITIAIFQCFKQIFILNLIEKLKSVHLLS